MNVHFPHPMYKSSNDNNIHLSSTPPPPIPHFPPLFIIDHRRSWKRRPLELATLRLQNMLGISLKHWKELKPSDEALKAGVLTQLGGCFVVESKTGKLKYSWRDQGICHVANFEDMLKKLSKNNIELDSNNKLNE